VPNGSPPISLGSGTICPFVWLHSSVTLSQFSYSAFQITHFIQSHIWLEIPSESKESIGKLSNCKYLQRTSPGYTCSIRGEQDMINIINIMIM
jgi:hypothetical protein